jgi:hypothetical protein
MILIVIKQLVARVLDALLNVYDGGIPNEKI